jgi:hypothetical protein
VSNAELSRAAASNPFEPSRRLWPDSPGRIRIREPVNEFVFAPSAIGHKRATTWAKDLFDFARADPYTERLFLAKPSRISRPT